MGGYVLGLPEIDRTQLAVVGRKAAHLGELARIEGVRVPAGFCVTASAFALVMAEASSIDDGLERLTRLSPDDRESISALSSEIRRAIEEVAVPDDLAAAIAGAIFELGEDAPCAVRSSATAEDLPTASFAGQLDTYLNVVGTAAILRHVSRCWASLFTERAVTYRLLKGFDHHGLGMAVIVQEMVFPEAAGILFTADPATSNRKVASVEAIFGLGEALVSGLVNADVYRVRDGGVVSRRIAVKQRAVHASPHGGTQEREIEPDRQDEPALSDAQVVRLATLGRRIEAHFGCPQDIEWCLVDGDFQIVQSRPITMLFPIPEVDDGQNHVYVSVGHQQMMTDAMKPLGLSVFQLTALRPMFEAGGRLFVDVAAELAAPASRAGLLEILGKSDPLIRDALETVLESGFVPSRPDGGPGAPPTGAAPTPLETDATIVTGLIESNRASVSLLQREIRSKSGSELFDFILADLGELKRMLQEPRSHQAIMAGMEAAWWLNDTLEAWLGEKNAADTLTRSVPHNVTSEMGLALLDVADVIRPYPDVVAFLARVEDDDFLDQLPELAGGREARDAIRGFLDAYGMRCVGEIDITRPRWSERPTALVPAILGNVRNFEPSAGKRLFERGRQEARAREEELLERVRELPDGEEKAAELKRMIDRVRTFIGYREYPKYGIVCRYFAYKKALLSEAERLVRSGVLREREDSFYLTFHELHEAVRTNRFDAEVVARRKDAFRKHQELMPPRVLTSDGEVVAGAYRRTDLPAGALIGLPVSAGTAEGRAHVVLDISEADLHPGDILVTVHTDPSWTTLFATIGGLVAEVGGLMTHGAVIAREYGLPAVVGVENATRVIRSGQRIRVHGTEGYVEILPPPEAG